MNIENTPTSDLNMPLINMDQQTPSNKTSQPWPWYVHLLIGFFVGCLLAIGVICLYEFYLLPKIRNEKNGNTPTPLFVRPTLPPTQNNRS